MFKWIAAVLVTILFLMAQLDAQCTKDSDCAPGLFCRNGAGCLNEIEYFATGKPCDSNADCPEACYTGRNPSTCGPWLI